MKKVREPSARDGWYEIVPEEATKLLAGMKSNRPVRSRRVMSIAQDIRAGAWAENGESLVFDVSGRVLDGQHRLTAVVETGCPIVAYCVFLTARGSEKVFDTLDQGSARSAGDRLALDGVPNPQLIAAMARMDIRAGELPFVTKGRWRDLHALGAQATRSHYRRDRDEYDYVALRVVERYPLYKGWVERSLLGYVYLRARRVSKDVAEGWFDRVTTGEHISREDPEYQLRSRLLQHAGVTTLNARTKAALMVKSFNLRLHGKRVQNLRFDPESEFPAFGDSSAGNSPEAPQMEAAV